MRSMLEAHCDLEIGAGMYIPVRVNPIWRDTSGREYVMASLTKPTWVYKLWWLGRLRQNRG